MWQTTLALLCQQARRLWRDFASHRNRPKSAFRHFSKDFDKRPRILAFQIKCRTSAGTFALNRRKVASRFFDRKSGRNGMKTCAFGVEREEMKRGAGQKNLEVPEVEDPRIFGQFLVINFWW